MSKIVTSLFVTEPQADAAIRQLEGAGIASRDISLISRTGPNRYWQGEQGRSEGKPGAPGEGRESISGFLTANGVPERDASAYAEGVHMGHALVAVRCGDGVVDQVVEILDTDGSIDIDRRKEDWRSESDIRRTSTAGTGAAAAAAPASNRAGRGEMREQAIPLAEEELTVGKRDVGHGRVRIMAHAVETPVEKQVTLREEHVDLERRPVESTVRSGGLSPEARDDLFRDRAIEVEEHREEPVVSKQTRVTEEIVPHKTVETRTETVSDKVRKTEVEVEDERGKHALRTGTRDKAK
jgi:stress response protein YsnF